MKHNKTLIVGDLHGKYECVEFALKMKDTNVIFIGDYLDSFDRSIEDQFKTLDLVIQAAIDEPDRVVGLLGNHEMSYLREDMICSGWNQEAQSMVDKRDLSILKTYVWEGGYLISHGGVSKSLLKNIDKTLKEYLEEKEFFQIGRFRGGKDKIGGIYWNDWFQEFEPIDSTPQIVGHSGYRPSNEKKGILEKENSYNVDCLDRVYEYLLLEKGKDPKIISHLEK